MKLRYLPLVIIGLCLPLAGLQAKIFRSVDEQGNVVFTDVPEKGAEEVELQPLSTFTPPPVPDRPEPQPEDTPEVVEYSLAITAPEDEETIWNTAGNVAVMLSVAPQLQPGDTIEVLVDGETRATTSSTTASLNGIVRGAHTIEAQVKNTAGDILATSAPIVVYIQQAAVGSPSRRVP